MSPIKNVLSSDLDAEFLQDKSISITKRNVLSVACQFYDPTGLAAPLMFSVCSLFSDICRDTMCSMTSVLSVDRTDQFVQLWIRSWRHQTSPSHLRLYSMYLVTSTYFSIVAFKDMDPVFTFVLRTNSIFSPVVPKFGKICFLSFAIRNVWWKSGC